MSRRCWTSRRPPSTRTTRRRHLCRRRRRAAAGAGAALEPDAREIRNPPPQAGQDTQAVLCEWGFAQDRIDALLAAGTIGA
ncbi:MAG: hypothetical protein U0X20_08970 [Caldilineaceae bacterium]